MNFPYALDQAMKANGLKDAHIAIMTDRSPFTVRKWRRGEKTPGLEIGQLLRRQLPGFAEHMDGISHDEIRRAA